MIKCKKIKEDQVYFQIEILNPGKKMLKLVQFLVSIMIKFQKRALK